jgi:uncharacterized protein (DUF2267 family)
MTIRAFDEPDLLDEITDEGFEDREHAERALRATIAAIAPCLTHDAAEKLARVLPAALQVELASPQGATPGEAAQVVERVHARESVSSGRAREEVQIVCGVLGRRLQEEDRREIARALPPEIGEDFERPPRGLPPSSTSAAEHGHTLATGRPGSLRPLSEASPERAHAESVVRSREPHHDTKLSSAEGMTQERERETLATGRSSR